MNSREEQTQLQKHTMRPIMYALGVNAVAIIGGMLLAGLAHDVYASIGGGWTVTGVVVVSTLVGTALYMGRVRRLQMTQDDLRKPQA
ncbi:hypothetical protein SRB5_60630 [Streptomyces sp. RB5]|uniref:Uncharacterized protein n=1 Tax=Streptomyces smaragdinus TaxID=2585196 RepID=A0A7K0CR40_9ACTN|nr:hypothetical protein [Streptomyces smaragdinus]MQY15871.1 hypothetical protein [Streptomyces smaragdinus]